MRRWSAPVCIIAIAAFATLLAQFTHADELFKWYGIGGELTGDSGQPRRWLGRIGIGDQMGLEAIFALAHADYSRTDLGAGVIYDVAPSAAVTPYFAGRFILVMTGDSENNTSAIFETACGVEYVIMKRIGVSGELNLNLHTDPSATYTSTRVRCYFYF